MLFWVCLLSTPPILHIAVSKLTATSTPVLGLEAASDLNHLSQNLLCRCSSSLCTFFLFWPHQCTDSITKAHPYHCSLSLPLSLTQVPRMIMGIYSLTSKAASPSLSSARAINAFCVYNKLDNSIWDSQTHVFGFITASLALRYICVLQHLPAGISLKEFVLYLLLQAPGWGGSRLEGLWRIKINVLS